MIPATETFNGTFPFKPHFTSAPGFRMHYTDEGKGPVILCLHGEPTWSYLFRHLISQLSENHRVIAPDHMGFGKSEAPAGRTYWLQDHIDNIEKFVLSLDLRDITLLLHDFGGPAGMGLAARHPDRIARVISINGPTPFGQPDLDQRLTDNIAVSPWFQWILAAEQQGKLETILHQLNYNILSTLKLNGFERNDLITDTWLDAYRAAFITPADCQGVIGWAKGLATNQHIFETPNDQARNIISNLPAMAIWGMADKTLQAQHFLPLFQSIFPKGQIAELPTAGHYSPEDDPITIGLLVEQFLALTPSNRSPEFQHQLR